MFYIKLLRALDFTEDFRPYKLLCLTSNCNLLIKNIQNHHTARAHSAPDTEPDPPLLSDLHEL
jgi:hypothetical protein